MALARYKDLCVDAVDARRIAGFWAPVLGLRPEPAPHGVVLCGPTPQHSVWINEVQEPKVVKHRMHIDAHGASVDDVTALGARVIDGDSFRWTVMADPEGGEFCLFVRDAVPDYRLYEINADCTDPRAMVAWWQGVLGGVIGHDDDDEGFSWVEQIPGAPFDGLLFEPVPEPKATKNRIHIDVVAPTVDPLLDAGATLLRSPDDDISWHVFADPEGNEFCVFAPA